MSKPWMCRTLSWSSVTVSVSFSPTLISTVEGGGVTFFPLTVTVRARPLAPGDTSPGPLEGWLGTVVVAPALDDVAEEDWVDDVEPFDGDPPHAVRLTTRASPAAYESTCRGVGFVTLRSLGSRF